MCESRYVFAVNATISNYMGSGGCAAAVIGFVVLQITNLGHSRSSIFLSMLTVAVYPEPFPNDDENATNLFFTLEQLLE